MTDRSGTEIPFRIEYVDGETVARFPDECEPHTQDPPDYGARIEWFEAMAEDHVQRQCRGCGLWAIWEPKAGHAPVTP